MISREGNTFLARGPRLMEAGRTNIQYNCPVQTEDVRVTVFSDRLASLIL
jgi:hypothetical protein